MAREALNRVLATSPNDVPHSSEPVSTEETHLHTVAGAPKHSKIASVNSDFAARADSGEPATARERTSAASAASTETTKPSSGRKPVFIGIGALALLAGVWFAYHYITVGRFIVSTDDAYVGVHMSMISPKVSAYVTDVPVTDNQFVREGDVLVRLDDGDRRLRLAGKIARDNAAGSATAHDHDIEAVIRHFGYPYSLF